MPCLTPRNSSSRLLIVNADDWGLDAHSTDAALRCFRARAITSATGMVWMADSERASEIARAEHVPIGLHLNLIEPFDAADVPDSVARTQREVAERLAARGPLALVYDPRSRAAFACTIADQLGQFRTLYGRDPTHVDGHRHMHLALNALLARPLAEVRRCRPAFTYLRQESPLHKRAARRLLNALIRTRFRTPDRLFNIRSLHPALGGVAMDEKLGMADRAAVEVMVHPAVDDEAAVLADEAWAARIARHRLGTYADL